MPRKTDPGNGRWIDYKYIFNSTGSLVEENIFGTFQFGKLQRAKVDELNDDGEDDNIMLKIWEVPKDECSRDDNVSRLMQEYMMFRHERLLNHPGIVGFHRYCWDGEHLFAIYKVNPLDTVHNLVPKDSFTWLQRIKVALGIAHLLKFLHTRDPHYGPFLVRNIAAAHFVVDKDYNPKLYDASMIVGGYVPSTTLHECAGCYGYVDPNIGCSGEWSTKTDVFALGVVLLNLITKRVDTEEDNVPLLYSLAWDLLESHKSESDSKHFTHSLVDQSLTLDPNFCVTDGNELTHLAVKCTSKIADDRPTMKQVVRFLKKLQVIKRHTEFMGLSKLEAVSGC